MFSLPVVNREHNTFIVWRGPSLFDRKPIVVVLNGVTRDSKNRGTGPMIQTWIIREDISPTEACDTGEDYSVCHDCRARPVNTNSCYVLVWQAPQMIWRYLSEYPMLPPDLKFDKPLRIGAYGDPGAVPKAVWLDLLGRAKKHTSYTHRWRSKRLQWLKEYSMASVDSEEEAKEALAMGWRYFRVRDENDPLLNDEIECMKSPKSKKKLVCAECCACDGGKNTKVSVSIISHGKGRKKYGG